MRLTRTRRERGTAAVEFALVAPFVLLLLFGMVTTGMAYSDHLSITNATREGARFGSAIDYTAGGGTWATSVRDRVKQVYNNNGSTLTDSEICVKVIDSTRTTIAVAGTSWTGANCGTAPNLTATTFPMTAGSCAVVVWVKKPSTIQLIIAPSLTFHLHAKAVSYYGLTVGTTCTAK